MDDFETDHFPADDFEVDFSTLNADDDTASLQSSPGHALFRTPRARRLAVALGVLLVIALIAVSVPSLPGQALGLFASASTPTPVSKGVSSIVLFQPTSGTGWTQSSSGTGEGWNRAGPYDAAAIAFAPSAPATAYTCGQQHPPDGQPVPLMFGLSRDAGQTWQMLSTPATGVSCDLTVNPTNPQDVLLMASPDRCVSPAKLYRTFDGGAHWSLWSLPSPGPSQSAALLCSQWVWVGSTLIIAPMLSGDPTYRRLAISVDEQAFTWLSLQSLFAGVRGDPTITELLATSATLYALVGSQPDAKNCCWFMQSRDDGASWSPFNPKFQGQPVFLLRGTGADGKTLLGAIAPDETDPTNRVYLRSTDGGATWSALPPHPEGLLGSLMWATPDGATYAAFDQRFSGTGQTLYGIYKATPGAAGWGYVASEPPGGLLAVAWDAAGHPAALWGRVDAQDVTSGLERHQP